MEHRARWIPTGRCVQCFATAQLSNAQFVTFAEAQALTLMKTVKCRCGGRYNMSLTLEAQVEG